jgi:hypothetical protein
VRMNAITTSARIPTAILEPSVLRKKESIGCPGPAKARRLP